VMTQAASKSVAIENRIMLPNGSKLMDTQATEHKDNGFPQSNTTKTVHKSPIPSSYREFSCGGEPRKARIFRIIGRQSLLSLTPLPDLITLPLADRFFCQKRSHFSCKPFWSD
jgi:hypothetical protein